MDGLSLHNFVHFSYINILHIDVRTKAKHNVYEHFDVNHNLWLSKKKINKSKKIKGRFTVSISS
jgi:hypothetical protein